MLPNKCKIDYVDLTTVFKLEQLHNINPGFNANGVSTDTRDIEVGNIFVALKGENSDGHSRVLEAFDKGAKAAVVCRKWFEENSSKLDGVSLLIVDDTLLALQMLANLHRSRFNIPIIAIAGSNGKTTTKEITAHILAEKYNVLKTHQNFNNQLGLALLMLQLNENHEVAVLEVGTNEPGEIYHLSKILNPSSGLITNIGKEHLEKLIDLDGVELEETALFAYLNRNDGLAFVNIDDERLSRYTLILDASFKFGANPQCDLSYELKMASDLSTTLTLKHSDTTATTNLKIKGYTNALNAVAAAAIALNYGFTLDEIAASLAKFKNTGSFDHSYGRMAVEEREGMMIINDCYNANPDSMLAAFANIEHISADGALKIATLGDMKEMGDAAKEEHINVLSKATQVFDIIYTYGSDFAQAGEAIKSDKVKHFATHAEINAEISKLKENKLIILVKGSRSMRMETIIENI